MRRPIKIIVSLVLVIAFLLICFVAFAVFAFGSWLHTYRSFTQKTLVAEISVSEIKREDNGLEYFELSYVARKDESALTKMFTSREEEDGFEDELVYKLYGDHFEIGGEVVKFNDFWVLFDLRNIYKVTRLEGDFTDVDMANKVAEQGNRTIFELNGGIDDYWKLFQENEQSASFLVDSVYGSYATRFVQNEPKEYNLFITEDGFILEEKEP